MLRTGVRSLGTAARLSLRIGIIPGDGIGHEVLPVMILFRYQLQPNF